ncbi:ABC transporter substrate-binding protein [Cereibacter azotoformans]|uniref:Extracellular solute-binding protein (Family 5) n=1 Tax=Cereibacter azotoformans TaxID=43057 RepID=A0A2T5JJI2_9RHOB|nr:ABC transporter substrate-binding protein [Cereibacter azotoformans]AXQ95412.1 hypothetical protein D0Z66_16465 [Cereibacter sphaeroides]PTR06382.1 extracellular solute-binding protein (family 5) [Cereibacter azotoformans]UIJ32354.1 ABC transporter substrate-binding protein [Cereibacter azotoformans]
MLRRITLAACLVTLCPLPALARDGIFDIAAPFEIKGPDPSLSGDIFLKMDLAETLVNADAEGRLLPGLSDRWDQSDDRLSWRFHIRSGVRFHDGTLLTAEAAAQSLRIARSRKGLLAKAPIAAIEAEGDEVVISLTEPFALVATLQAELPVLPIAWYQQTAAVARGVTGAVLDPYERSFGLKTRAFSH